MTRTLALAEAAVTSATVCDAELSVSGGRADRSRACPADGVVYGAASESAAQGGPSDAGAQGASGAYPRDERVATLAQGRIIYLRSCRPCHGMLGEGDGPYAASFATRAPSLVVRGRGTSSSESRSRHVELGSAALAQAERPWDSAMPAFGTALSAREIGAVMAAIDELGTLAASRSRRPADPASAYEARCAPCHGSGGAGDGPLAAELFPRPRDFTRGAYRLRSTQSGSMPLETDLRRTLERGLADTAMGAFGALGSPTLSALVATLKGFAAERFAAPAMPIAIPAERPATAAILARGRTLYDDARCWQCHGANGRGDGPSARELRDDTGDASLPANLTKRWQLKGGGGAAEIFRTISTGMSGTPMPSYGDALEAADRWALSRYVESLGRPRPLPPRRLRAPMIEPSLPLDPAAPAWRQLTSTAIPLGPQMLSEPRWSKASVDVARLAVAASGDEIGFLVAWDDRFEDAARDDIEAPRDTMVDARRVGRWHLPDQLALQLAPLATVPPLLPPLYLGDAEHPVVRWTWSAEGRRDDVRAESVAGAASTPRALPIATEDGKAILRARSAHADGEWRVLILARRDAMVSTSRIGPDGDFGLAVQIWDGSYGETGGRHALSSWITVSIPRAGKHPLRGSSDGAAASAQTASRGTASSSAVTSSQP